MVEKPNQCCRWSWRVVDEWGGDWKGRGIAIRTDDWLAASAAPSLKLGWARQREANHGRKGWLMRFGGWRGRRDGSEGELRMPLSGRVHNPKLVSHVRDVLWSWESESVSRDWRWKEQGKKAMNWLDFKWWMERKKRSAVQWWFDLVDWDVYLCDGGQQEDQPEEGRGGGNKTTQREEREG